MIQDPNPIDLTEDVENLSDSRWEIAAYRAERKVGYLDIEDEEFLEALAEELKLMVVDDIMDGLIKKGLVQTSTNETGELLYYVPDEVREVIDESSN